MGMMGLRHMFLSAASDMTSQFTGKERDAETGLDYFGARYYSGAQGRFTSVDPISATALHLINPQRWNMYVYATNNPLLNIDPDRNTVTKYGDRQRNSRIVLPLVPYAGLKYIGGRKSLDTHCLRIPLP
jgi:RHS repeat-associated protein